MAVCSENVIWSYFTDNIMGVAVHVKFDQHRGIRLGTEDGGLIHVQQLVDLCSCGAPDGGQNFNGILNTELVSNANPVGVIVCSVYNFPDKTMNFAVMDIVVIG